MSSSQKVSLGDIEGTLRRIQVDLDEATTTAKPAGIAVGSSLLVGVLGISYLLGHRRARRQTTVVEIRRS